MASSSNKNDSKQGRTNLGRATGIISGLTFLSRILGLVRDATIAAMFGAGLASDAFFVAFKIPNLLRRLVAEGSMATAFVPVLSDEIATSPSATKKAISAVATCSLLLTSTLTIIGMFWAKELTWLFAPGFGIGTEKNLLATDLLLILFPYVVIVGLLAITSSALQSFNRFGLPAAAPAILNMSMISMVFCISRYSSEPVYYLALAVPIGGTIALILQLRALRLLGYTVKLINPKGVAAVKKLFTLMLPSVISASVYQILVFINTLLASLLEEGSVSWLYFADRIFQFPLGVFTLAVATAVLPTLSRLATENKSQELQARIDHTLGWITFITIPATIGLIILSQPIISAIFEHWNFSSTDSINTAQALTAYALGLWPISCQTIIVRCYLSKKNSTIPAIISSSALLINVYFAFALMGMPSSESGGNVNEYITAIWNTIGIASLGHQGLALSSSISTSISMLCLFFFLKKVQLETNWKHLLKELLRCLIASAIMGAPVYYINNYLSSPLLTIIIGVPIGGFVYFIATHILGSSQTREIFKFAQNKYL